MRSDDRSGQPAQAEMSLAIPRQTDVTRPFSWGQSTHQVAGTIWHGLCRGLDCWHIGFRCPGVILDKLNLHVSCNILQHVCSAAGQLITAGQ